jgi:hypothetical protein
VSPLPLTRLPIRPHVWSVTEPSPEQRQAACVPAKPPFLHMSTAGFGGLMTTSPPAPVRPAARHIRCPGEDRCQTQARFSSSWTSASQVHPMPPWICRQSRAPRTAASSASSFAPATSARARAPSSGSPSSSTAATPPAAGSARPRADASSVATSGPGRSARPASPAHAGPGVHRHRDRRRLPSFAAHLSGVRTTGRIPNGSDHLSVNNGRTAMSDTRTPDRLADARTLWELLERRIALTPTHRC